jgi:hypothetical protein
MSDQGNRFALRLWFGLGFVGGIIMGRNMAMKAGLSVMLTVWCSLGVGVAGAILLTVVMALYFAMYRMDLFPRE